MATFLDDFYGTPERPGRDEIPGVMTQLQTLKEGQAQQVADQAEVKTALEVSDQRQDAAIASIATRLDEIKPLIVETHHETQPNGGSSLKDQMTRVDKKLGEGD